MYCSRVCQKKNWSKHKLICKTIQKKSEMRGLGVLVLEMLKNALKNVTPPPSFMMPVSEMPLDKIHWTGVEPENQKMTTKYMTLSEQYSPLCEKYNELDLARQYFGDLLAEISEQEWLVFMELHQKLFNPTVFKMGKYSDKQIQFMNRLFQIYIRHHVDNHKKAEDMGIFIPKIGPRPSLSNSRVLMWFACEKTLPVLMSLLFHDDDGGKEDRNVDIFDKVTDSELAKLVNSFLNGKHRS